MYCPQVCLQIEKGVSVSVVLFHLGPHQEVCLQTEKEVSVNVVIFHLLECVLLPCQEGCLQTEKGVSVNLNAHLYSVAYLHVDSHMPTALGKDGGEREGGGNEGRGL